MLDKAEEQQLRDIIARQQIYNLLCDYMHAQDRLLPELHRSVFFDDATTDYGDGYAAGFFYGLLSGESPQDAVNLGWAHGALLTTFPGDTTMATVEQVRALAQGGSARIQR